MAIINDPHFTGDRDVSASRLNGIPEDRKAATKELRVLKQTCAACHLTYRN